MIAVGRIGRFGALAGLLILGGVMVGGCENKLKAERDALYAQNQELQQNLTESRNALNAAEADRAKLADRIAALEAAKATEATTATTAVKGPKGAAGDGSSGFEGMEGVRAGHNKNGEVTVEVSSDVLFDSGKATLKETAKKTLSKVAGVLKSKYASQTIRIEGYTDSDPIRKAHFKNNLELSVARAMAVQTYLASKGIPTKQMYSAGFGDADPKASNATSAGKAKNRRVEIVVVK